MKREYWVLTAIFLLGLLTNILSILPYNTIVGYDQARDLFDARKIVLNRDLRVIGPTAGNNPSLHHGVAFLYFMIPPIFLGGGNPAWVAIWNSFFNALSVIAVFFLAENIFKSKKVAIIAGLITAVSYYFTQFSGWLSNPTVTLLTVPLFFYGFWKYYEGKKWGLPLAFFSLGITIQFELFFIYLIPTGIIAWLILKPKFPSIKLTLISLLAFFVATSTMLATEIKFNFAGVRNILGAGNFVGGGEKMGFSQLLIPFLTQKWEAFYLNFWPQNKSFGMIFGLIIVAFFVYEIAKKYKRKNIRKRNLFLLLWLFSPVTMLFVGIHNAPWFLVGRPHAAILMASYVISKIESKYLLAPILLFIVAMNLFAEKDAYGKGQPLLEPDESAILSSQVAVMDYTYQKARGQAFAINTVTNPLYINAVFGWNYDWYSKKYGYKPSWLGGDQLPPYNTLSTATGSEKYFFLIIDKTPRIPEVHKILARQWAKQRGKLIEEKEFGGWQVSMWETRQKLK